MAVVLGEFLTPYFQSQPASHWTAGPITLPSKSTPYITLSVNALVSHHNLSPLPGQLHSLLPFMLSSIWFSHNRQDSLFFFPPLEIFQWLLITFGGEKNQTFCLGLLRFLTSSSPFSCPPIHFPIRLPPFWPFFKTLVSFLFQGHGACCPFCGHSPSIPSLASSQAPRRS